MMQTSYSEVSSTDTHLIMTVSGIGTVSGEVNVARLASAMVPTLGFATGNPVGIPPQGLAPVPLTAAGMTTSSLIYTIIESGETSRPVTGFEDVPSSTHAGMSAATEMTTAINAVLLCFPVSRAICLANHDYPNQRPTTPQYGSSWMA